MPCPKWISSDQGCVDVPEILFKLVQRHSTSPELCIELCICFPQKSTRQRAQTCHLHTSPTDTLMEQIESRPDNTHFQYLSHLLHTKHQSDYYKFVLKSLEA